MKITLALAALVMPMLLVLNSQISIAFAFEGKITTSVTRGGQTQTLLYTVGTNQLRIECQETDRPYPCDIFDLSSGQLTVLFPNNRSFVRLPSAGENASPTPPRFPQMPPPPGGMPAQIGPTNVPGIPNMPAVPPRPGIPQMPVSGGMPAMPMMPPMPMERAELKAMNDTTNILGYACTRYVLEQRGETMEIWATDKLLPFQPYMQNQPHRFGPHMIEEQWGELLKAKKLFPLLAALRFEVPAGPGNVAPPAGPDRMRFEVKAITPDKITDETLFQPPPDYQEIQPLPF
jgi:Domain of unknown function (DUF4412)